MGLIALSAILSLVLGAGVWLLLGDRFPLRTKGAEDAEDKWPTTYNILCYALILLVPLYLCIFFTFSVLIP